MDNYCSPQWVDFTSTSDVPSEDYFEKNHEVPNIIISAEKFNTEEVIENKKIYENVEKELNIIKNTPIKVIYSSSSTHSSNKKKIIKEATYNDVLQEAIEAFEHCISSESDVFKKPMPTKSKVSRTLKLYPMDNDQMNILSSQKIKGIKEGTPNQEIKVLSPAIIENHLAEVKYDNDKKSSLNFFNSNTSANSLLKTDESDLKLGVDNCPVFCTPTSYTKSLSVPNEYRQCKSLERKSSNRRSKPVTYQCRRYSLKSNRRSNEYINLAAAVLRFQNETPERFHTKCTKNLKLKAASEKKPSFSTRKNIWTKSNLRRSIPVSIQNEKTESNCDIMKELTKEKLISSEKALRKKNVITTIVDNTGSEIVFKKEKILFFDIPAYTKQKKETRPIPFSFEQRDKAKRQAKLEQTQVKDNKLNNVVKSKNIPSKQPCSQTKISTSSSNVRGKAQHSANIKSDPNNKNDKKVETKEETGNSLEINKTLKNNSHKGGKNSETKIAITDKNVKDTIKIKQSMPVSSLSPREKTEDKSKRNENTQNKDMKQLKMQSKSMSSINSHDKKKGIHKDKNTEHMTLIKDTNQMKKQSTSKHDPGKKTSYTNNCISVQAENQHCFKEQENRAPNVNACTSNNDLKQTRCMKSKNAIIGMHSYERGKQRHAFDEKIKQKIMMQEETHQKMEAERLAAEKLQITMLRKQLEVKARPMPVFKPPPPIRSTKPLTVAQSPNWANKKKTKDI